MFEKNNPFDAFINISEHLSDLESGDFEKIKTKFDDFLINNRKEIKYFVASGEYDDPNRLPSGLAIEKMFLDSKESNISFKHKIYKSWHVDLIAHSVNDAFNFIFKDYQNYSLFEECLSNKSFNYAETKRNYINKNEKYIFPYFEPENSQAVIFKIINKANNSDLLKQYFDFEDPDFEIFNSYQRSLLFYEEANDLGKAIKLLETITISNEENSVSQIVLSKAEIYFEIYKKAGKSEQAYKNLEMLLANNTDFDLELKFILARIGLENKIQVEKSEKYLKQVEKSFRENKLFNKKDIEKLKKK